MRAGCERRFDRDLVGSHQVEEVLVEGLHALAAAAGHEVDELAGACRILDAFLDAARGAHHFDRGHAAGFFLVDQQAQRHDGLQVLRESRAPRRR